jgi:hypothetical protein
MINNILERIKLTKEDIHGMINDAKQEAAVATKKDIMLGQAMTSIPNSLQQKIVEAGKTQEFNIFINNLPGGTSYSVMVSFLNSLKTKEQNEFVKMLYSKDSIADVSSNDYSSGVGSKLYDLEPKGIGKAELLLAALIRNSKISGGGESFDLTVGNKKYEVKDYRNYPNSKPIRLGTKGKVTQFSFWGEIIKTLNVINDLVVSDGIRFIKNENLKKLILDIYSRIDTITAGALVKDDIKKFKQLYIDFNKLSQSNATGYTYVTFRGPNASPVSYMIDEIPTELKNNVSLNLKERGVSETLIIELKRIKYVRNPEDLSNDFQQAVDSAIGNEIPFIIFRSEGPKIATEFKFDHISLGGIYIKEKE